VPNVDLTIVSSTAILLAGAAAGFINAIVGSGTLISFPTLLGVGFERLAANMANNVGLFPGSVSATYGFRRELAGQRQRLQRLAPASALGAATGALLLLRLPSSYFKAVVPFLILIGVGLVAIQPKIQQRLRMKRAQATDSDRALDPHQQLAHPERLPSALIAAVFLAGIYGGYFGAAQGVILIGVLGTVLPDDLVRVNALKNALATVVNGVAAVVFAIRGDIPWAAAGLVAVGSVIGAQIGSGVGRRIPATVLRAAIITVGSVVAIKMLIEL
jgi:uncharacterized protein